MTDCNKFKRLTLNELIAKYDKEFEEEYPSILEQQSKSKL